MPLDNSIAENAAKYGRIMLQKKCTIKDNCAICIDSLLTNPVMYLPCKHFFHKCCLKQAFEKNLYTCPLCRYDLVDALLKTDFKFPLINDMHNDMHTYANTIFYSYPYIYPDSSNPDIDQTYTYPALQDDDMTELFDDFFDDFYDDSSLLWNRLFSNVMHNDPPRSALPPARFLLGRGATLV